ncbi:MAG: hypothetical protein IKA82_01420 [Clostridia bacterium]|nr:hypothetical protein [Clostridia bacterium]
MSFNKTKRNSSSESLELNADRVKLTMSMSSYLRKYSLLGAIGVILIIIQSTVFGHHDIFPATPNLAYMLVIAVAFLDGAAPGAVFAICAGALTDMLGAQSVTPQCLFFLLAAVACSLFMGQRLSNGLPGWILCSASACAVYSVYTMLYISVTSAGYSLLDLFGKTVIPELWCTLLFGVPIYYIVRTTVKNF